MRHAPRDQQYSTRKEEYIGRKNEERTNAQKRSIAIRVRGRRIVSLDGRVSSSLLLICAIRRGKIITVHVTIVAIVYPLRHELNLVGSLLRKKRKERSGREEEKSNTSESRNIEKQASKSLTYVEAIHRLIGHDVLSRWGWEHIDGTGQFEVHGSLGFEMSCHDDYTLNKNTN